MLYMFSKCQLENAHLCDKRVCLMFREVMPVPILSGKVRHALKKISATHVIKLGCAPKAYPPGQHHKTSTVGGKMYCLCD